MLKKLTLLAMSVAALVAFAGPTAAQAEPLVTNALGEAAEELTGEGTEVKTVTANGILECTTVKLNIKTTSNTGNTYTGHGTGTASGNPKVAGPHETCGSSSGATVKITSIVVQDIHLTKGGTKSAKFTYTYDLYSHAVSTTTPVAVCHFEGTVGLNYTSGGNVLTITEGGLTGTGTALCPTTGTISGEFDVFDENGETAIIH